jgi:hypothetical protein
MVILAIGEQMLKPGDVVTVYEDPWTEKRPEGEAKLIEKVGDDGEREQWLVKFVFDQSRHPRWIKKGQGDRTPPPSWESLSEAIVREAEIPTFTPALLGLVKQAWETKKDQRFWEWIITPVSEGVTVTLLGTAKPHEFFPKELIEKMHYDEAQRVYHTSSGSNPAKSLQTMLDEAIADKDKAAKGYTVLMQKLRASPNPNLSVAVFGMIQDEKSHKEALEKIKNALGF